MHYLFFEQISNLIDKNQGSMINKRENLLPDYSTIDKSWNFLNLNFIYACLTVSFAKL
jgi:hypothetical protein